MNMPPRLVFIVSTLATWFGCGRARHAPGTVGTLGAVPLVWGLHQLGELPYMIVTFAFVVLAVAVAQIYEDYISPSHDPSEFVMDEVAGFLITMTWIPLTWEWVLTGFLLFRVLDMVKPYPISYIDRWVPGGLGSVADDVVAGIVANIGLQAVLKYGYLPI